MRSSLVKGKPFRIWSQADCSCSSFRGLLQNSVLFFTTVAARPFSYGHWAIVPEAVWSLFIRDRRGIQDWYIYTGQGLYVIPCDTQSRLWGRSIRKGTAWGEEKEKRDTVKPTTWKWRIGGPLSIEETVGNDLVQGMCIRPSDKQGDSVWGTICQSYDKGSGTVWQNGKDSACGPAQNSRFYVRMWDPATYTGHGLCLRPRGRVRRTK